jgi:hypothetical protein
MYLPRGQTSSQTGEELQDVGLSFRYPIDVIAKLSNRRVAEMEEKLDGLMALLAARQTGNEASPSSESSSTPYQPPPPLSPPDIEIQAFTQPVSSSVSSISFSRSDISRHQQSLPVFSLPSFDSFNDVISKGLVTFSQAEESVRYFQSRVSNFPFVLVPPKMSLDCLRRERPFFLLSILSFAAHKNEKLQLRLESELRESLSKRVIVHCEKSIDILQGVLLYLAWYESRGLIYLFLLTTEGTISTLNLIGNKCTNFHRWPQL